MIGQHVKGMLTRVGRAVGLIEAEAPKKATGAVYSILNLHKSQTPSDLLSAHENVLQYHLPLMEERQTYYDAVRPKSAWSEEEKEELRRKKKPVIAFSRMKSSERAFIGNLVLQKYEIKAAPLEPSDQSLADTISVLYTTAINDARARYKDVNLIRDAWVGGNAWQEVYVEVGPGQKPRLIIQNLNNFAVYPDPNRRDLVENSDCRFIDRKGFYSVDEIVSRYPEHEDEIRAALQNPTSITYQQSRPWADRQHEHLNELNGRYAVIERLYRVTRRRWDAVEREGATAGSRVTVGYDMDADARAEHQRAHAGHTLVHADEEWLYLAVACPGVDVYLHNGPYHAQPRNPKTGRIMFPWLELVDESLGGQPTGHVEHMIGPAKAINAMAVNTLAQAKAAGGAGHIGDPNAFDEAGKRDIAEHIGDPNRVFWMKPGERPGAASQPMVPVRQGTLGGDTQRGLQFAEAALEDASSTPPSMKGMSEGNVAAALNENRVQQAATQSVVAVTNYQLFLTNRALLMCAYWAEFWDFEDVVRVVEKSDPNGPDFIKINELVADAWGRPTRRNDLSELIRYDIVFVESWQSPTMRDQTRRGIQQLLGTTTVQADPVLSAFLQYYFLLLTDAPAALKDGFLQHSQVLQQRDAEQAARAQEDAHIDQAARLQEMADREALATAPPDQPPPLATSGMPADMAHTL